jgi:hypothetical protein
MLHTHSLNICYVSVQFEATTYDYMMNGSKLIEVSNTIYDSNSQPIFYIHNILIKSILMVSCSIENKITKQDIEISSLIKCWWPTKVKNIQSHFSHIFKHVKICFDLIPF